jgi:outer membrane receptor protein involved in Fe transport
VSVITGADIEHRRPRTLIDVIREAVPTAVVFDNPARPDATSFSVRGASSLTSLGVMKVFIDGLETSVFTAPVDPANIERIEVVRGPQAATLYGSDAASGVVQIFTKRGDASLNRPRVAAQAALGVAQTPYDGAGGVLRQQYTGSARGGSGDVSYNLGGGYTHLADWLPNGEPSRQSSPNAYGAIQYSRGIVAMDLHGRYFRNKLATGLNPLFLTAGFVPFSRPNYLDQDFANETYGARFAVAPTDWWRNQVTVGVDRHTVSSVQTQRRLTTPADTLFQVVTLNNRKLSLYYNTAVTGRLSTDVGGTLTAGIDHYDTDASSFFTSQAVATTGTIVTEPSGSLSESRATIANTGYFAQVEVGWRDAVFLTAGVRAEDNSTFGQSLGMPVLPRLGVSAVQRFGEVEVKVRGAYGRAIRAPAPGQAFGGAGQTQITLANPRLAPERQRGWDAGIDLVLDRATLSLSGYDQTAEDLIVFVQLPTSGIPTAQFQNVGRVANSGLEVEGILDLGTLELKAQYGYSRSRIEDLGPGVSPTADLQIGDRPLGLPTHTAGTALVVEPRAGTTLTAGLTYVGSFRQLDVIALIRCVGGTGPCPESFLSAGSTRDFLVDYPDFAKVNAGITQRITPQLEGFVSVDNLTNNLAYEGTNTGGVMGRITMAGVHVAF